ENANNQRVQMSYEYDSTIRSYPTKVTDNLGYFSTTEYEFKYGNILKATDTNGNIVKYKYDNSGRLTQVNGPKEPNESTQYTIKFEYYPSDDINGPNYYPYAITKHFDEQKPTNPIETYTFTSGIGRIVQVKKDIDLQ